MKQLYLLSKQTGKCQQQLLFYESNIAVPKKQEDILIAQTLLVFSSHSDNELVSKMCEFRVNKVDRKDCKILN